MKHQRRSSPRNRQVPSRNRPLRMESLEGRLMLAADLAAFQNPFNASDVDNDEHITPRDALIVINLINLPEMRGDVVGGFIDVNDDDFISTHDALGVIDTLNNPETNPVTVADKFNRLVVTLDNIPTTLDGNLKVVKDKLVTTQKEMKQAHDVMRAELNEFLEFAVDQHVALEKRFQDLEDSMNFSFTIMEREIRETANEFTEINAEMFDEVDFDRLGTEVNVVEEVLDPEITAIDNQDPVDCDFLLDDFSWDDVEDLGDGLEALFSDLEDMVSTTDIENPVESL
ncbi:MAG: dockerin type I domain-containing protein, partial [Pirellulaceae bacterium]|nr:dockerin type I domain-containing protein [Pirellulaceae bacterium]